MSRRLRLRRDSSARQRTGSDAMALREKVATCPRLAAAKVRIWQVWHVKYFRDGSADARPQRTGPRMQANPQLGTGSQHNVAPEILPNFINPVYKHTLKKLEGSAHGTRTPDSYFRRTPTHGEYV
ncbi:hypothetical protein NM688_g4275 [Phlebia brevispora]|uniref:Uncharacterized protein n=1 Tax=Phlebia brevispora TaxID=194682 RepID=A0ACC1T338_9APHY|nr:hypothetical protein NM688_g4275 [Phlebia brevispora]